MAAGELASIDFRAMIGGPLSSVVKAQTDAALTTVDFIKSVGFDDSDKPRVVDFKYTKTDADGNPQEFTLSVPFLTIIPIPFLRVEETRIAFKAKINSISTFDSSTSTNFSGSLNVSAEFKKASVELKVSASYQKKTNIGNEVNRTYSLDVDVLAVQDEIPAGMERILGILEDSINAAPTAE